MIRMVGKKFGRLTVVSRSDNVGVSVTWNCICDCGNEVVVHGRSLKHGKTKSCGCLRFKKVKEEVRKEQEFYKKFEVKE